MIVHPYREKEKLQTIAGRLLLDDFGLIGQNIRDTDISERIWTIQGMYTPIWGRHVSGVRAKVKDQKGFVSFINQRDLEVLLGEGKPEELCPWLGEEYVSPYNDRHWVGFAMDAEEMDDDLYDREQVMRFDWLEVCGGSAQALPANNAPPLEVEREVYLGPRLDRVERLYLHRDYDPETGEMPDTKISTVRRRWTRIDITASNWAMEPYR